MTQRMHTGWLTGESRKIHELKLGPQDGFVVLYLQGATSMGRLVSSTEDMRGSLLPSAMPPSKILYARAFGDATTIIAIEHALAKLGVEVRNPVALSEDQNAVLQFLPDEGRVRAQKRPSPPAKSTPQSVDRPKRVLIVDDSEPIRRMLSRVLSMDAGLECVGSVSRPSQVADAVRELKPDVITMDLHMPEMNGVELIRQLLPRHAVPVVVISSLSREEGPLVLDALEAGAVDYIQKPAFSELAAAAPLICDKVRNAAAAQVTVRRAQSTSKTQSRSQILPIHLDLDWLCLIGSSTGGTEALREVLTPLPATIPPILIVQHIPPVFSKALADRLSTLCRFEVREATDGDQLLPNRALIAPGGLQMKVRRHGKELRVQIEDSPPVNRHKPSVDVLFDSVSELGLPKVNAAILTGMGSDGAKGLARLRKQGARTLSQDEATSVVYGMPKEALRLGGSERSVALPQIPHALMEIWSQPKADRRPSAIPSVMGQPQKRRAD